MEVILFHGMVSREEADAQLSECDGCYLVRESQRAPGSYTLSMRFNDVTKNYRLFYDGHHYVGDKRFETLQELVADGLITLYMETHAADYIAVMANESDYEESPYFKLNSQLRRSRTQDSIHSNKSLQLSGKAAELEPVEIPVDDIDFLPDRETPETSSQQGDYETPHPDAVRGLEEALERKRLDVHHYEKAHQFKVHTFRGPHWCDFCGNFLWGLIAQGVRCQDCGFNAHKKCSEKIPNDCLPNTKYVQRMFGVDLTTLAKAHNRPLPIVMEKCIKEVEARGLDAEGLFRVSGFNDDIEAIKASFDKDGENTDISRDAYEDTNTVCGVLKLFFRLLPIPIITFDTYDTFIQAAKESEDLQLEGIKDGISKLPPAHYQTLKNLIQHLYRVSQLSHKNLMTMENLAMVFGPTLMRSPDSDPMTSLHNAKFGQIVVELLIRHQAQLFRK
ncbi:PREDICTED: beta-chimaerin-like isoform X2 [Priapulus caudatus]|uniref:Beta-chimaerin-like isoform X2 n=1 Tax=Priapulus caudatus TaxID=37621 RepID=A0ABM1F885_PRICU|nr:PREDICTED: beta-chimaerin-like isoform X2 [Priapulus caudatus]